MASGPTTGLTPGIAADDLIGLREHKPRARRKRRSFSQWRRQYKREDVVMGYLFLLFPMVIFLVFFFFAMIFDFGISFTSWHILDSPKWVGLDNYQQILTPNQFNAFWIAVGNSITYAVIVVPVQTALAFGLAVIVNQNIRGKKFFRTAFYFPSVTSSVAITLLFLWLFNQIGLVNYLLGRIGLGPVGWVTDPNIVLKSIMGLNIWTTSGTYMIIFLAALQDVPRDMYEAAAIDGANAWQAIRRITIPLIRPATFLIVTTGLIGCLQIFDQVFVAQGNGAPVNATLTMVVYIYQEGLTSLFYGRAAAAAFIMFVIIMVATLLVRRFIREESVY
jgi:multiple sugar transport system permease protein